MSVCTTCLKPGLPADGLHDCPGLGDIQLTRQLGHGLRVDTAPARARMALTVLADHGYGLAMVGEDQVNIADQVLYQVVGYDPESAALILELVEDWRPGSSATADGICAATIKGYEGPLFRCVRPAGHYDGDKQPDPLSDDPGGWHRSAPGRGDLPTTWSDWASSATPHTEAAVSGYPTPEMRKKMQDVKPGAPPSGPAGASSANGKPAPTPEES